MATALGKGRIRFMCGLQRLSSHLTHFKGHDTTTLHKNFGKTEKIYEDRAVF